MIDLLAYVGGLAIGIAGCGLAGYFLICAANFVREWLFM